MHCVTPRFLIRINGLIHAVCSVPPGHTSIGILAAIIVHLESQAPKPVLEADTPIFETARCFAAYGSTMPSDIKHAISHARKSGKHLKKAEAHLLQDEMFRAMVGTTQAVDISGGVKSNALPEQASVNDLRQLVLRDRLIYTSRL